MLDKLTSRQKLIGGAAISFIFFVIVFGLFAPPAVDWIDTFYPAARIPLHPYDIWSFINPPWAALILWPLGFLRQNWAQAVNAALNLVVVSLLVIKSKGDRIALVLTLTSFPFLALIANGSIEWMPALGFLLQNGWGIPFLLAKPQSGLLAGLVWFLKSKKKIWFVLPGLALVLASFLVWKNWIGALLANVQYMQKIQRGLFTVSVSLWPWSIIPGVALLVYFLWTAFRPQANREDERLQRRQELVAVAASLCFSPYFVPHSVTIFFALLSGYKRSYAFAAWLLLWLYPLVTHWGTFLSILHL